MKVTTLRLSDVIRSIILESNPALPNSRIDVLIKKYERTAKWADSD